MSFKLAKINFLKFFEIKNIQISLSVIYLINLTHHFDNENNRSHKSNHSIEPQF